LIVATPAGVNFVFKSLLSLNVSKIALAKMNGYSDIQIAETVKGGAAEDDVRTKRKNAGVVPVTK